MHWDALLMWRWNVYIFFSKQTLTFSIRWLEIDQLSCHPVLMIPIDIVMKVKDIRISTAKLTKNFQVSCAEEVGGGGLLRIFDDTLVSKWRNIDMRDVSTFFGGGFLSSPTRTLLFAIVVQSTSWKVGGNRSHCDGISVASLFSWRRNELINQQKRSIYTPFCVSKKLTNITTSCVMISIQFSLLKKVQFSGFSIVVSRCVYNFNKIFLKFSWKHSSFDILCIWQFDI